MIQNDTLDSSDVNKMSTPALERLFIEVSNASTTLVNNNYTGYEMVNDNVNDIELNTNNANANINNNNNSTILNGSSNGSYGNLHHPLSYPSHDGNLNDNLQHQPSSHNNTNTNHVINHHHHVTNPVFPCNDSLLSESLSGNIHRSSRLVPPEYNHLNHHHSNGNSSANHHNHNSNSHNLSGDGAGPSLHVNGGGGGVYSTPNHLQNHSLAQPSSVASSSTIPISMSSVSSPVTLTTLSSSSTTTNGGVVVPISTSSNCGLMQVKNEQSEQMASGSKSNGNQIITSNNHAQNGLNNCPSGSSSSSSSQSASGPGPVTPSASLTISPPVSPIDMEEQEKFKLERKRQRNRIAASKCRKRKLEKIHLLEKRVNELKDENEQLSTKVNKLRDHVCCLKREVIQHINSGCPIASPDQHQQPL